jgi:hypothetical protein
MRNHLRRRHDIYVKFEKEVLKAFLNRPVIIEALITLIVVRNLSFYTVEWTELYTFAQALNLEAEGILPKSHSIVHNYIERSFLRHKDIVRRLLQSAASSIHVALDIWTSPNR